jgi:hypothetical protein
MVLCGMYNTLIFLVPVRLRVCFPIVVVRAVATAATVPSVPVIYHHLSLYRICLLLYLCLADRRVAV